MAFIRAIFESVALQFNRGPQAPKIGMFSLCEQVQFGRHNRVHRFVRLKNVQMGDSSYVANGARIQNCVIGKYCSVGPNSRIGLGLHPSRSYVSTHPAFYSVSGESPLSFVSESQFVDHETIRIANDVWIGEGALVLDGVTIGNGAIVGAGAVVTKDVAPYAVVVGVPAKLSRFRFDPDDVAFLEALEWWNRDLSWIEANAHLFPDIKRFREEHKR